MLLPPGGMTVRQMPAAAHILTVMTIRVAQSDFLAIQLLFLSVLLFNILVGPIST